MSKTRILMALGSAALLAACAVSPSGVPKPPTAIPSAAQFNPADFAWSTKPGAARIDGRMTLVLNQVRYGCAGASVAATPETPWVSRRIGILYGATSGAAIPADDVRARAPSAPSGDYQQFIRATTCGPDNRFSLQGLPAGAWFVITLAKPVSGTGPDLAVMRRVVVREGRAVVVEL